MSQEFELEGSLEEQINKAHEIIGNMAQGFRGPKMSVPAGSLLNANPCGDEDIFLTTLIDNLYAEVQRLQS